MKAFIIHTKHPKSVKYANASLKSFENYSGWEPILFEGVTPETLPLWEEKYPLNVKSKSRVANFEKKDYPKFLAKKSCSYNHYRLFKKCIEMDEPIAIIEHDSDCKNDWKEYKFNDILMMNAKSAINLKKFKRIQQRNRHTLKKGIHDIGFIGLTYKHQTNIKFAYMMPGTAAYAVTPVGASKMLKVYETIGWEQSDFIINTAYVQIQTIIPELFMFTRPNLAMSHGRNIK